MRIAGILILGVIISIYGFISANKLISENSQLEKIIKIISIIKLKMRYSNEKITDLVKDLSVDYSFLFLELEHSVIIPTSSCMLFSSFSILSIVSLAYRTSSESNDK